MKRYHFLLLLLLAFLSTVAQDKVLADSIETAGYLKNAASKASDSLNPYMAENDLSDDTYAVDTAYSEDEESGGYYEGRTASDSVYKALLADPGLKYKKPELPKAEKKKPLEQDNAWDKLLEGFFRFLYKCRYVFLVIFIIGLIALLAWFLDKNKMLVLRSPEKAQGEEEKSIDLWGAAEYRIQISNATKNGDLKLAVRWWYLYTLYNLNGKKMIALGEEKTNNEYLRNMRSTPYYKTFASLTLDYEYVWYGGFIPDDARFQNIRKSFSDFNDTIEGES